MLTLHYFPGSCAFVPHVALEWSGLPYRTQAETRESIKAPAYLNMNPMGQAPLLEDGGSARFVDGEAAQQALAAKGREAILRLYGIVEEALAGQNFLAGELSIADVYVYTTLRWAKGLKLDLSAFPRLAAYFDRVGANPGVMAVLQQENG